ncbi:MAG: hypothetical protein AB7O67_08240 [Vicinamibacterales bacterium]
MSLRIAGVLAACGMALQPDAPLELGRVERDLTGDGRPEILRVVGTRRSADRMDAVFTIESGGALVYRTELRPLTPQAFDAGPPLTHDEYEITLRQFGGWFFDARKFQTPEAFLEALHDSVPLHVARIPVVIAGNRPEHEHRDGAAIWAEIRASPVTIFTFSPGGDALTAIGWSARAGRFYSLLECC